MLETKHLIKCLITSYANRLRLAINSARHAIQIPSLPKPEVGSSDKSSYLCNSNFVQAKSRTSDKGHTDTPRKGKTTPIKGKPFCKGTTELSLCRLDGCIASILIWVSISEPKLCERSTLCLKLLDSELRVLGTP